LGGLRQEQGRHEERVSGQLDDADLAPVTDPAHAQATRFESREVVAIDPVVAVVVLDR
jgi:hypothetical protein